MSAELYNTVTSPEVAVFSFSDFGKGENIVIALVGIIVHSSDAVEKVNSILHGYRDIVVGRMGLPMRDKGLNLISIALDADAGRINALTGKLGGIEGVRAKALYGGV